MTESSATISSIYSELVNKRRADKEAKDEQKRLEKEAKRLEKEGSEEETPKTKKEKRQAELDAWNEIIIGLTGDDLDYIPKKKNKRKYKKWVGDELTENVVLKGKAQKKKKRNYNKEFEPELNMLKAVVADQNKFIADLQKRYQTAAGPNTKDAMPLNKNLIELAAVVNNARGNSLGLLREIGNIKRTIANLYMDQKNFDAKYGGLGSLESQDLGLMGSNIASSMFNPTGNPIYSAPTVDSNVPTMPSQEMVFSRFDPSTWDGGGLVDDSTRFETMDKTIVVEWHKESDIARFKAVDPSGNEIVGCPVPTCSIKTIDQNNKMAKDEFDQVYQVEVI